MAILEWLGSYVESTEHAGHAVLIVYENGKIPRFVREIGLDPDVLTTRAFLELAERRGSSPVQRSIDNVSARPRPRPNPDLTIMIQRRPSG